MPEQAATPNLVELTRQAFEAFVRRDFAAHMSVYAPGAVFDAWPLGLTFEGNAAIRRFLEDWVESYEDYQVEIVESRDLDNDVVFFVTRQDGRPPGSPLSVGETWAFTVEWEARMIARVTITRDIDAGRSAAERLAQERR